MLAVIVVRDGMLPGGAEEAISECAGRAVLAGSGTTDAAATLEGTAREVTTIELGDFHPAAWAVVLAAQLADERIIVLPASPDGRDLAPRLAAVLRRPLHASAMAVAPSRVDLSTRRWHRVASDRAPIILHRHASARRARRGSHRRRHRCTGDNVTPPSGSHDAMIEQVLPPDVTTIDLSEADRIVAGAVAAALSAALDDSATVWCGDHSLDRGSGSVPAFLAARLQRQQALGLVEVHLGDPLRVTRRLDGGRRELLRITGPAALSVEGSVARLRRASLRASLAAQTGEVWSHATTLVACDHTSPGVMHAYRPPARVLPGPAGATPLEAGPAEAARRIVEVLGDWGYLEPQP